MSAGRDRYSILLRGPDRVRECVIVSTTGKVESLAMRGHLCRARILRLEEKDWEMGRKRRSPRLD
jgi:hypothetical protein